MHRLDFAQKKIETPLHAKFYCSKNPNIWKMKIKDSCVRSWITMQALRLFVSQLFDYAPPPHLLWAKIYPSNETAAEAPRMAPRKRLQWCVWQKSDVCSAMTKRARLLALCCPAKESGSLRMEAREWLGKKGEKSGYNFWTGHFCKSQKKTIKHSYNRHRHNTD